MDYGGLLCAFLRLDQIEKDGRISEAELKRLHDADVLADAANRVAYIAEVDTKWLSLEKDEDGQIERLKCWGSILSDGSLVALLAGDTRRTREGKPYCWQ